MASRSKVEGVIYVPYNMPKVIAISPDNGQGITERVDFCTRWECQCWDGDQAVAPILVRCARGFRICSVCGCSYGK